MGVLTILLWLTPDYISIDKMSETIPKLCRVMSILCVLLYKKFLMQNRSKNTLTLCGQMPVFSILLLLTPDTRFYVCLWKYSSVKG